MAKNKHENTMLRKHFKKNAYSHQYRWRAYRRMMDEAEGEDHWENVSPIINPTKHPSREKLPHHKRHIIRWASKQAEELSHCQRREIQNVCMQAHREHGSE